MARFVVFLSLFLLVCLPLVSQTPSPNPTPTPVSDVQAITIATQSYAALGGALATDATLNGTVTWIVGSDDKTGTATFYVKGTSESRADLTFGGNTQSETRTLSNGFPSGQWKTATGTISAASQSNCWVDAAWFFPALSSLAQTANTNFIFSYVGREQHNGLTVLHLEVKQLVPGDTAGLNVSRFSVMDVYIDPTSFLPTSIAYNLHADLDSATNVPAEIRFADYRLVNGVEVPFHVQKLLNGSLLMDVVLTNAKTNTGLTDAQFILQ
jgi:hypothetical protein